MNHGIWLLIGSLTLLILAGCKDEKPAAHASRSRIATTQPVKEPDLRTVATLLDKQAAAAPAPGSSALPAGHPPIEPKPAASPGGGLPPGHPPIESPAPAGRAADGLKYTAPAAWKQTPVTKTMRKDQFLLPRAAGDPEDGELVVFYFGRDQGGTVESNIDRWKGMFTTPEGRPVGDSAAKRESSKVDGMSVTLLDVTGRYADSMGRPGQAGPTEQDFRMLAAIVETPNGPWFFKAVGPKATMAAQAPAFQDFIRSMRK
jgi:hypothetical protein